MKKNIYMFLLIIIGISLCCFSNTKQANAKDKESINRNQNRKKSKKKNGIECDEVFHKSFYTNTRKIIFTGVYEEIEITGKKGLKKIFSKLASLKKLKRVSKNAPKYSGSYELKILTKNRDKISIVFSGYITVNNKRYHLKNKRLSRNLYNISKKYGKVIKRW